MATEFVDWVLWGDETEAVEDELELPEDLYRRMKQWAAAYYKQATAGPPWSADEVLAHDRRGWRMSQELQAVLGDAFFVTYHPMTAEVRRELRAAKRA